MGDYKTAIVLAFVVFINTIIGFVQEMNAERAISALASLTVPQCCVVRDGEQKMIDSGDLVPGDVVVLEEGSAVPADLRLCVVSQLAVVEILLTGESVPMEKNTNKIPAMKRVPIGDRLNMAFQSTTVTRGRAVGVVVNTGRTTEIGRISTAIANTSVGKTPLQKKLEKLGQLLVVAALIACGLVVAAGIAWDPKDLHVIQVKTPPTKWSGARKSRSWTDRSVVMCDVRQVGVSLALSVIPEGLVAIVTLTMAMVRSENNGCISVPQSLWHDTPAATCVLSPRRACNGWPSGTLWSASSRRSRCAYATTCPAPGQTSDFSSRAPQTLGSVTTICSDKTGTITEGIMRARLMWFAPGTLASVSPITGPNGA
jgi:magnesium-transporting ATPase (P-type)